MFVAKRNATENKNSNHLAAPRLPPSCYSFCDDSTAQQKRQILAVAGPLLILCRKIDEVPHTEQTSDVRERPSWNLFG